MTEAELRGELWKVFTVVERGFKFTPPLVWISAS